MNITRESYNQSADEYDKKFSVYAPYIRHIKGFASLFRKNDKILDAGCGTGLNSRIFSDAGLKVTGFDFSESMIKIAKKNCPAGNFYTSTVREFKTAEQFEGVCLSFIIVHLEDEDTAFFLKKMTAILKPGGYLYISFMTGKAPGYETTSFSDSKIFFNYYETKNIIEILEKKDLLLENNKSEPYAEENGSITEDVFLIFKKPVN